MNTEDTSADSDDGETDSSPGGNTTGNASDERIDGTAGEAAGESTTGTDRRDVVTYLEWGAVAALGLVALVAVFRFYFAASRAISIWINPDFEPVFQAAFNLVVLLFAAAGIVALARRLQ